MLFKASHHVCSSTQPLSYLKKTLPSFRSLRFDVSQMSILTYLYIYKRHSTMKKILLGLIVVAFIGSCKKDTSYQFSILIKNETNNKLKVHLFPKTEYQHGDLYDFDDIGGGYADTSFVIDTNSQEDIYTSSNLDQKPYNLACKIFDSIYITSNDTTIAIMKFSKDKVTGYPDNLFNANSVWIYNKRNYDEKTNFSSHRVEDHQYFFVLVSGF